MVRFLFWWNGKRMKYSKIQSKGCGKCCQHNECKKLTDQDYWCLQGLTTKNEEAYNYYLLGPYQKTTNIIRHHLKMLFVIWEGHGTWISTFIRPYLGPRRYFMLLVELFGACLWWGRKRGKLPKYYLERFKNDDWQSTMSDQLYVGKFYFEWDFEALSNT